MNPFLDSCLEHGPDAIVTFVGHKCPICAEAKDVFDYEEKIQQLEDTIADLNKKIAEISIT
jgi:hypothetical protein